MVSTYAPLCCLKGRLPIHAQRIQIGVTVGKSTQAANVSVKCCPPRQRLSSSGLDIWVATTRCQQKAKAVLVPVETGPPCGRPAVKIGFRHVASFRMKEAEQGQRICSLVKATWRVASIVAPADSHGRDRPALIIGSIDVAAVVDEAQAAVGEDHDVAGVGVRAEARGVFAEDHGALGARDPLQARDGPPPQTQ